MTITESDRLLLKYADISEKDFENQSIDEQEKSLRKGMNKYLQSRKNKRKPEYVDNARNEIPKIKELLRKNVLIYAKAVGIYQIVGYIDNKKKILVINSESTVEEPKIYKIDENQVITTVDD